MNPGTRTAIEITLPSGIFAHIRPVRLLDGCIADLQSKAAEHEYAKVPGDERAGVPMYVAALIAQVVLFDDRRFTIEQVLELDQRDSSRIIEALHRYITGPIR